MSFLTIIQKAALKVGVPKPTLAIGNTDLEIQELCSFAEEEAIELSKACNWQALTKENTFVSLAAEEQASLPTDFGRFVNETFWNRSRKHPLYGPLSAKQWQHVKNWYSSPVTDSFTVRGKKILVSPVPAAGETFVFDYISSNICQDTGGTQKATFTLDSDETILDEHLIELGTIVRFKLSKGLDAGGDIGKYEAQLGLYIGQESPKATVNMSGESYRNNVPNAIIPEGDWNL